MSDAFAIRAARPGDEAALLGLLWDFAVFEKLTHIFKLTHEIITRDFMGETPRVRCDIAESEGAVVGLMIWVPLYGTFEARPALYLEDLYVRPEFRGRGIGTAFLKRLARHALAEGANRIDWLVLDWNAPAIAFYRGIGASLPDEWRICRLRGDALKELAAG